MSSLIPGYKYDIFISYRQKDNKGDRWVSEFVQALKTEIESTFKEEISVYFDINPDNGLLEMHDVDASLKEKLRCLIFIPIVSRTYCDPNSFAWEHEFKVFVEQASKDQFGLKIKLPNGNVANRVLPVRIHDLDIEDIKECESVLGSVLRGVEFIYKEHGVDKPLAPGDNEKRNLNNTIYGIQIIKVAHAIKEIIQGMKAEPNAVVKENANTIELLYVSKEEKEPELDKKPDKFNRNRLLSGISGLALIIIAVLFLFPRIFKRDKFEDIRDPDGRITIAVMPFENLTGDTTLNWFQRGISSLIINGLGNSSELAVCDDHTMFEVLESVNRVYTAGISPSVAREVAKKAKAETYLSGSFQGREDTYWILVNLVSTETGNLLWTNRIEGNLKSSAYLTLADSLCNEIKNYLELKALEDIANYDFREVYPKSAEAYRYFIEGMNLVLSQNSEAGIRSLKKALEIDSTFTFAAFYLAYAYNTSSWEQTKYWTNKAYLNKERVPPKYQLWIELWHACLFSKNNREVSRYCDLLAESGINTRFFWSDLGVTYYEYLRQYDKAIEAFENVMKICTERNDNWEFVSFWDRFLRALHETGNHEREKEIYELGLKAIPNRSNYFYYRKLVCALSHGDTSAVNEVLPKYFAKHKELGTPEVTLERFLGNMYEEANLLDQAEIHYRRVHEIDPVLIATLAQFLIDHEINVDEGIELLDKGLTSRPGLSAYLGLKGWGLYKQGKYEEALKLLSEAWDKESDFNLDLYNYLEAAKKAVAGL
jgi:TolB-like protein